MTEPFTSAPCLSAQPSPGRRWWIAGTQEQAGMSHEPHRPPHLAGTASSCDQHGWLGEDFFPSITMYYDNC